MRKDEGHRSPPTAPFARHPSLNQGLGEVKQDGGNLAPGLGHHHHGHHHLGQHIGHHHFRHNHQSQLADLPQPLNELPKMIPEKGLDYQCNRIKTLPWHFEDSVEKVEEGVKVETWFSNRQGSYLDTQLARSDRGTSDVTLPSKKKKRRVLFSKVGLPGSSWDIILESRPYLIFVILGPHRTIYACKMGTKKSANSCLQSLQILCTGGGAE